MSAARLARPFAVGTALLAATFALSACRTSPSAAAYVGDQTITTTELDAAVDEGLAVPAIADLYTDRVGEYRQLVLQGLIEAEVYDAVAATYDIEVSDADIGARLADVLEQQGAPAEDFFAAQAAQGTTEAGVREQIRQFIIGEEVASAAGLDDPTSESALRELYDTTVEDYTQYSVGLITVADQATADTVLAALTADPASYDAQVAANPNPNTYPVQAVTAEQLVGIGADPATLAPGQGYTGDLAGTGEITVVFITAIEVPAFDDLRPTLEQQAGEQVQAAVQEELQAVRGSLDVTVNPRFGTYDSSGTLGPAESDVVSVVESAPAADADPLN